MTMKARLSAMGEASDGKSPAGDSAPGAGPAAGGSSASATGVGPGISLWAAVGKEDGSTAGAARSSASPLRAISFSGLIVSTFSRQTMRSLSLSTTSLNQSQARSFRSSALSTISSRRRASALRPALATVIARSNVPLTSISFGLSTPGTPSFPPLLARCALAAPITPGFQCTSGSDPGYAIFVVAHKEVRSQNGLFDL
jgi:hypothetical protein